MHIHSCTRTCRDVEGEDRDKSNDPNNEILLLHSPIHHCIVELVEHACGQIGKQRIGESVAMLRGSLQ